MTPKDDDQCDPGSHGDAIHPNFVFSPGMGGAKAIKTICSGELRGRSDDRNDNDVGEFPVIC